MRTSTCLLVCHLVGAFDPALAQAPTNPPQLRVEASHHAAPGRRIALEPQRRSFVTAGDDKTARLWSVETGELLRVFRLPIGPGWEGRLYGAAWSPRGDVIAVAGDTGAGFGLQNQVYLFDRNSAAIRSALAASSGSIKRLEWSADGRYLAACSGQPAPELAVFDMQSANPAALRTALAGDCYGLDFGPGNVLAATQFGGRLSLFKVGKSGLEAAGQAQLSGQHPISVAFSPDRTRLAVGYFGSRLPITAEVFSLGRDGTLERVTSLSGRGLKEGSLGSVAWSQSGRWLYAAGNGDRGNNEFIIRRWSTQNWDSTDIAAASNSVNDLAALPDDGVAFVGQDGNWGVFNGAGELHRRPSALLDLRGASALKISPDGMIVQWTALITGTTQHFDLRQRAMRPGAGSGLKDAETWVFGLSVGPWENTLEPTLNGVPLKLDQGERSRSVAVMPDKRSVVLGADRSLNRYDSKAQLVWQVPVPAEARAVVPTADGERLVVAHGDGSIRWYRARDGVMLLSLVPHADGTRWVLWQPDGYYDVAPGADRAVGWHVNRQLNQAADFFPLSQFRHIYHRPDVLDQYITKWDLAGARPAADAIIRAEALAEPPAAPKVITESLPPTLELMSAAEVRTRDHRLTVRLRGRTDPKSPIQSVRVRVEGAEVDLASPVDIARLQRGEPIDLDIPIPPHNVIVTVVASNERGYSSPAAVRVARLVDPVPAEPPSAATTYAIATPRIVTTPLRPSLPEPIAARTAKPTLYILAVGVSRYANEAYNNLLLPAKDAKDFVETALRQREASLYADVQVRLLTDGEATRAGVLQGLDWLRKSVRTTDTAMLFLAGHGVSLVDRSYYFLPHDANVDKLAQTAITHSQLTRAIGGIKGQRLLFIDTCHAGNALGGRRFSTEVAYLINDLTADENAVVVYSSSTGKQLSIEKDSWGNGAFTKVLVDGIKGGADIRKTGMITQKGLDFFISEEVPRLTQGLQTPMTIIPFGTRTSRSSKAR